MIGIYKITNTKNGKTYIGQSMNLERRKTEHFSRKKPTNSLISREIIKYGRENFVFEIIETIPNKDREKLYELEMKYIKLLKPKYNKTIGGSGVKGHVVSQETRKILSEKAKLQWLNKSEEEKQKTISYFKSPEIGHVVSQETREKLRQRNLGKKQSEETIMKRKETMLSKKQNGWVKNGEPHKKAVMIIETEQVFDSVKSLAEYLSVTPSTISHILKGRRKTVKGFTVKYCSVETNRDECSGVRWS